MATPRRQMAFHFQGKHPSIIYTDRHCIECVVIGHSEDRARLTACNLMRSKGWEVGLEDLVLMGTTITRADAIAYDGVERSFQTGPLPKIADPSIGKRPRPRGW
jgi:hypothetical protein